MDKFWLETAAELIINSWQLHGEELNRFWIVHLKIPLALQFKKKKENKKGIKISYGAAEYAVPGEFCGKSPSCTMAWAQKGFCSLIQT